MDIIRTTTARFEAGLCSCLCNKQNHHRVGNSEEVELHSDTSDNQGWKRDYIGVQLLKLKSGGLEVAAACRNGQVAWG